MIELEIRPEFFLSGLKIKDGGYLSFDQQILPNVLFQKVICFNNDYLKFARLSMSNRRLFSKEIYELDCLGFELKTEIEKITSNKVYYFSEGLQRYLLVHPTSDYSPDRLNCYDRIKKKIIIKSFNRFGFYEKTSQSSRTRL